MLPPKYTKLDANLNPLPDDHPNDGPDKHLLTRVEHPNLPAPVIASAYRAEIWADFDDGKKIAEEFTVHGKPCRAGSFEEMALIPDRTRTDGRLDPNFFPDAEGYEPTWTGDVDNESPAGLAWVVALGGGDCFRIPRSFRIHVRPVLAGQS